MDLFKYRTSMVRSWCIPVLCTIFRINTVLWCYIYHMYRTKHTCKNKIENILIMNLYHSMSWFSRRQIDSSFLIFSPENRIWPFRQLFEYNIIIIILLLLLYLWLSLLLLLLILLLLLLSLTSDKALVRLLGTEDTEQLGLSEGEYELTISVSGLYVAMPTASGARDSDAEPSKSGGKRSGFSLPLTTIGKVHLDTGFTNIVTIETTP